VPLIYHGCPEFHEISSTGVLNSITSRNFIKIGFDMDDFSFWLAFDGGT
jgi:hypothetical protein